jgi:hypothetical protein
LGGASGIVTEVWDSGRVVVDIWQGSAGVVLDSDQVQKTAQFNIPLEGLPLNGGFECANCYSRTALYRHGDYIKCHDCGETWANQEDFLNGVNGMLYGKQAQFDAAGIAQGVKVGDYVSAQTGMMTEPLSAEVRAISYEDDEVFLFLPYIKTQSEAEGFATYSALSGGMLVSADLSCIMQIEKSAQVMVSDTIPCGWCNGTGKATNNDDSHSSCTICQGVGLLPKKWNGGEPEPGVNPDWSTAERNAQAKTCPNCGGTQGKPNLIPSTYGTGSEGGYRRCTDKFHDKGKTAWNPRMGVIKVEGGYHDGMEVSVLFSGTGSEYWLQSESRRPLFEGGYYDRTDANGNSSYNIVPMQFEKNDGFWKSMKDGYPRPAGQMGNTPAETMEKARKQVQAWLNKEYSNGSSYGGTAVIILSSGDYATTAKKGDSVACKSCGWSGSVSDDQPVGAHKCPKCGDGVMKTAGATDGPPREYQPGRWVFNETGITNSQGEKVVRRHEYTSKGEADAGYKAVMDAKTGSVDLVMDALDDYFGGQEVAGDVVANLTPEQYGTLVGLTADEAVEWAKSDFSPSWIVKTSQTYDLDLTGIIGMDEIFEMVRAKIDSGEMDDNDLANIQAAYEYAKGESNTSLGTFDRDVFLDQLDGAGYRVKTSGRVMLLTQEILSKVPALYAQDGKGMDALVYAHFFTPDSSWDWYLTELSGQEAFGYVMGLENEMGYFSMTELESVTGPMGLNIERDRYFPVGTATLNDVVSGKVAKTAYSQDDMASEVAKELKKRNKSMKEYDEDADLNDEVTQAAESSLEKTAGASIYSGYGVTKDMVALVDAGEFTHSGILPNGMEFFVFTRDQMAAVVGLASKYEQFFVYVMDVGEVYGYISLSDMLQEIERSCRIPDPRFAATKTKKRKPPAIPKTCAVCGTTFKTSWNAAAPTTRQLCPKCRAKVKTSEKAMSDFLDEGKKAYWAGTKKADCSYSGEERSEWEKGWDEAYRRDMGDKKTASRPTASMLAARPRRKRIQP